MLLGGGGVLGIRKSAQFYRKSENPFTILAKSKSARNNGFWELQVLKSVKFLKCKSEIRTDIWLKSGSSGRLSIRKSAIYSGEIRKSVAKKRQNLTIRKSLLPPPRNEQTSVNRENMFLRNTLFFIRNLFRGIGLRVS